jgi:Dinucleotide-utilizing enzymes involved in molybdopterin and thiamine biosynthesis family 1
MLIGEENLIKLNNAKIAVFGIGGVGSFAAETLVRSGISNISLFDADTVDETNINRQIIALHSTIGKHKAEVMKKRILDINPQAKVFSHICFYSHENSGDYDFSDFDYIIDAIDTVSSKLEIICRANRAGVKVISCMGTGNKLNPSMLEIDDIYNTSVCPLARVIRYELRKRNIKKLKVIYSKEPPISLVQSPQRASDSGKLPPSSAPFVPAVAGIMMASEVIRDIIKIK